MIFKPDLVKLVLRGIKTETRRPVKSGEHDCRYRLQHSYSVQRPPTDKERRDGYRGRAKSIDGVRLIVTDIEKQQLGKIDKAAAVREGFANEIQFAHYWMRLYETGWPEQVEELCPRCHGHAEIDNDPCPNKCDVGTVLVDQAYTPDEIWERFTARHGSTDVWVIRFELEQDQLRLLTPTTRPHGSELGYTTEPWNAMDQEPEAIDLGLLHKDWRTRAQAHHRASLQAVNDETLGWRTDEERMLRTEEERLVALKRLAALNGVDIRNDVNVIRQRMEAIERKIRTKTDGRAA